MDNLEFYVRALKNDAVGTRRGLRIAPIDTDAGDVPSARTGTAVTEAVLALM